MKIRHTFLLGLGGTGGWLAEPAARLLAYHPEARPAVTYLDGDDFEARNGERQATGGKVGANKALATLRRLQLTTIDTSSMDAVPCYVYDDDILQLIADSDYTLGLTPDDGVVCIILAVDNDFTRADIIRTMEASKHEFLIINPGNEYDTFTCSMQARIAGFDIGGSLLERYPQYANPDPKEAPGHEGCLDQMAGTPQLITANMAAATAALSVLECWLSDRKIPLALSGRVGGLSCATEGALSLPGWEGASALRRSYEEASI